jgi:alpha-mannosidase
MDKPRFRYEGSNSVIEPLVDQFPGSNSNYYPVQHWAGVCDGQATVTLAPIESHLLEFGGLWPCYVSQAHHGFTPPGFGRDFVKASDLTKGHIYSFVMDSNFRTNFQPVQQGDMVFRYSLTTHKGDWKQGDCRNFGWAAANPLMPVVVNGKRNGPLPVASSFCRVDKPSVLIVTLKRAEDGDGIIVRLVETQGDGVTAKISLPHLVVNRAYRTNLVEAEPQEIAFDEHSIEASVKAFGITTIRIQTD